MERRRTTDVSRVPELAALARKVQGTQEPQGVTEGAVGVAESAPATAKRRSRRHEPNPNAWLEPLIGIAHSDGTGDISSNKKKYLAEAYQGKREDHTLE